MAEYNLVCLNCQHGPHANGRCKDCPCEHWIRADVVCARSLLQLNNLLRESIPKFLSLGVDLLELLVTVFPEAAAAVDAKREAYRNENAPSPQQQGTEPNPPGQDASNGQADSEKGSE